MIKKSGEYIIGNQLRSLVSKISKTTAYVPFLCVAGNSGQISQLNKPHKYSVRDLVISGHRGMGKEMPENTIDAFKTANNLNLDYAETDVWLTKDQVPVVIHGDNGFGQCEMENEKTKEKKSIWITKTNYNDLKNFVYIKSGAPVPTLEQVLHIFKEGTTKLNLEFKDWRPQVVKETLDIIFKNKMADQIFFSSFNHKHSLTIQKELEKMNRPKNTFGFGYLVDQWYNVPEWEMIEKQINPGIDYITMDTEMMLYGWKSDFKEVRDKANKYGVGLSTYIGMDFQNYEKDSFYDEVVRNGVKIFITNAPRRLIGYKARKVKEEISTDQKSE